MKSTFTRIMSAIMALLMLLSVVLVMASCAESGEEDENKTEAESESAELESEEDTAYRPDFGDEKFDFGKSEFTFLTSGSSDDNGVDWETYDIWVEKTIAEPLNDAVYNRNVFIEDTYNVKIVQVKSTGTVLSQATKDLKSGDDVYGAVVGNFNCLSTLADKGQLLDLKSLDYLDLSAAWWDQNVVSTCSINNKLYYATGDITVIDNDATWVLYFNTNMIAQKAEMQSPFELVENNEWTYDKFYEMIQLSGKGDDATGKYDPKTSTYGFATTGDSAQGLMFSAGIQFASKDEDDLPVNMIEQSVDKLTNVATYAASIMNCEQCVNLIKDKVLTTADDIRQVFEENRAMFYGEVLQCATRMRSSETDFGLVTWPKFDTNQSRYYNFVHAGAGKAVSIPYTVQDTKRSAVILEAMAAESKNTVTIAYYDICLGAKYLRDEVSRNMLDKISESTVYDLGYIYNWGNLYSTLRDSIANNKVNASSTITKYSKKFNTAMAKTVKNYQK